MKVRWTKGIVALLLAVMMILGTAACSKGAENTAANGTSENDKTPATGTDTPATADEPAGTDTPAEEEKTFAVYDNDEDIYMANLGEFYADYQKATEASSVSERYALLAVAEAKVLESGVATPMYGGIAGYQMSRIVYCSGGYAPWRGDMSDMSQMIITNEIILGEDQNHLRDLRNELMGTGTYIQKAVEYLTEKGYTFQDTYTSTFVDNPTTWDIFAASTNTDAGIIGPTFDYLFAYDAEGVMQPRMAESYEISEDPPRPDLGRFSGPQDSGCHRR